MENPSDLERKLHRITSCVGASFYDTVTRSLLHAYTACLSPSELAIVARRLPVLDAEVRGAVRRRLLRLHAEGVGMPQLDQLGAHLLELRPSDAKERVRIDAELSQLYLLFSPPIRQAVLERWRDRGGRGANARWLKALASDPLLFSAAAVLDAWRTTHDWRAAKVLAYQAEPELLGGVLPELVLYCDEGWIISRAALRASSIAADTWELIRARFPATYLYLAAKTGRDVTEQEALSLVRAARTGGSDDEGLAIWSVGQLGMWQVLERIEAEAASL